MVMVVHVLADRQVREDRDIELAQLACRPHAGKHEYFRGIKTACGQYDVLGGEKGLAVECSNTYGCLFLEDDAGHLGISEDLQITWSIDEHVGCCRAEAVIRRIW